MLLLKLGLRAGGVGVRMSSHVSVHCPITFHFLAFSRNFDAFGLSPQQLFLVQWLLLSLFFRSPRTTAVSLCLPRLLSLLSAHVNESVTKRAIFHFTSLVPDDHLFTNSHFSVETFATSHPRLAALSYYLHGRVGSWQFRSTCAW